MKKEYDFSKLQKAEPKYLRHLKERVTIRLNPHVLSYFKKLSAESGVPYQSLINHVLKDYTAMGLKPSANWPQSSLTRR